MVGATHFKGHFALSHGHLRCHPLTVLYDYSRFAAGVKACSDEQGSTVRTRLEQAFRTYGLSERILTDSRQKLTIANLKDCPKK